MKISIIVPVYNGEETIERCLASITRQDYPFEDYEIIVVDDGSTDGTASLVRRSFPHVHLICLEKNMGRIIARETGARAAKFDLLFFMDSRGIAESDVLKMASEITYQPLCGGDWNDEELKYQSPFDTLFYLLRKKIYPSYFPQYKYPDKAPYFFIDEENFDESPKGLTCLFVDKSLFLSCQPFNKGKEINDDTRILREIVKKKKIMRHIGVRFYYLQRTRFLEVMRHICERGPRFADYYLAKGGKYRMLYLTLLSCAILCILSVIFYPKVFLAELAMMLTINTLVALWFAENIRDFFVAFFFLPHVALSFAFGVFKWQIGVGEKRGIYKNNGKDA